MSVPRHAMLIAAALFAGLWSSTASAACYVIYSASQEVIYRSPTPPVDLSREIHQTLQRTAPGATLVFTLDNAGCELELNRLPTGTGAALPAQSSTPRLVRPERS
ncbi:hypothetical protein M5C99_14325 [Acidovorax sp. NCPPB 2350]|nr:hypothetical protein M5C99_14325 [Acidovorax sp. NCPPB 2350]